MVRSNTLRKAFTLLELIFAIVIIAVSVIALPIMIQVNSRGVENNFLQEAIFAASAQLNEATTFKWDEFSTQDLNTSLLSRVINTNAGGCPRLGHISRVCLDDLATRPSNLASAGGVSLDSIAYAIPRPVLEGIGISSDSYKENYNSTLVVTQCIGGNVFIPLNPAVPTDENLKQIEYQITDAGGTVLVTLRAYSTNIGEVEPDQRGL